MSEIPLPVVIKHTDLEGSKRGRPVGSTNSSTRSVRIAIATVFDELDGAQGLLAWAKADAENLRLFYTKIYPKLITSRFHEADGTPIRHSIDIHFI